jgi:hypothetical protein
VQLRTGLANAGLPPALAGCMAQDMTPQLSLKQLMRLRDLSRAGDRYPAEMTIDRYLHQVGALGDGQIWSITTRAAARCALGL